MIVTVETMADFLGRPTCGVRAETKDRVRVDIRDLPCFGRPARLVWLKRRWRCADPRLCGQDVDRRPEHREHARVELAIRDLKRRGRTRARSLGVLANAAWLLCAVLAHDLIRWTAALGDLTPVDHLTVARTVRIRFFSVPGRLVSRSGVPTLRAPLE